MEPERNEVYERIPWEHLQQPKPDRQWLMVGVAAAVALGALAYSFVKNQPATVLSAPAPPLTAVTAPVATVPPATATTVAAPMVVAEADLYAVDPERLIDQAVAHAEWFAVEYFSVDGSEESRRTLASLMPAGVPLPEAEPGVQVFVDWAGALSVTETAPLTYRIEVAVRSLRAVGEEAFVRQPTRLAILEVGFDPEGRPRVLWPPEVSVPPTGAPQPLTLDQVPAALADQVAASYGEVVGGTALSDGRWRVVVMAPGVDGVRRPVTVTVP
ncbi:MAG: hypothetical protein ACE5F5_09665 [Acidimicrobiia bacterium]